MHNNLEKIKSYESPPKVIKDFIDPKEISQFLKLYEKLPVTVNNLKQKTKHACGKQTLNATSYKLAVAGEFG